MAWRTGYFYGGGFGGLSVANIPYSDYTHILYESISPNGGGGIDTSPANLSELATFVANCHAAGVKALICIGVADAGSWQGSTNSGNVASFASAVAGFVSAQNLDGVDLDWESGINVSQYADFIQRLRGALGSSKVISIAAYGGGGSSPKAAVAAAGASYLDQVNLMSYDMGIYEARSWYNTAIHTGPNGEWSIEATLFEFTTSGIPVSKLGIGIPFYGLSFSGDTAAGQANTYSGSPSFSNINTSGSTYDATYGGESVVSGGGWITYAGPSLISAIVSYGGSAGVGGYMTFPINWEDSGHTLSAALAGGTGASTPTVPTIYSFSANPATVTSGATSILSWSTSGSTSLSIDNGIGTVTGSTTHTVNPTATTTYTLTATNAQGPVTKTVTVTIGSGAPAIQSFTVSPASFIPGATVTLAWSTSLASSLSIDNGVGSVTGLTSKTDAPTATTTYTLSATNGSGTVTATATATVGTTAALGSPALPVIQSFTPGSTAITQGASTTLSFSVLGAGAKGVSITPDIGVVSGSSVTVTPLTTTTYTLTAQNGTGAVSQSVQIVVHGSVGENVRVHQIRRDERHGDHQILQASDGTGVPRHLAGFLVDGTLTDSGIDALDITDSAIQPYHVVFYLPGQLTAGVDEPVMQWTCPADLAEGVSFDAAFGGFAKGYLQDNPTATATCNIYRIAAGSAAGTLGTLIGHIVISTGGVFTFSLTAESFTAGDSMTVWPPVTVDSTLSGVGWTLPGIRGPTSSIGLGGSGGTGGTGTGDAITVNSTATVAINGIGASFDDSVLVNGA